MSWSDGGRGTGGSTPFGWGGGDRGDAVGPTGPASWDTPSATPPSAPVTGAPTTGPGWGPTPTTDPSPFGATASHFGGPGPDTSVRADRGPSGPSGPSGPLETGPPMPWLLIAAVPPLLAAGLLVLAGPAVNAIGWALSAFGAVTGLAVFQVLDLRRRVSDWYSARDDLIGAARLAVLLLALLVAGVHAWFFADWVSRLDVFA